MWDLFIIPYIQLGSRDYLFIHVFWGVGPQQGAWISVLWTLPPLLTPLSLSSGTVSQAAVPPSGAAAIRCTCHWTRTETWQWLSRRRTKARPWLEGPPPTAATMSAAGPVPVPGPAALSSAREKSGCRTPLSPWRRRASLSVDASHARPLPLGGYAEWQRRGGATARKSWMEDEDEASTEDGTGAPVANAAIMALGWTRGGAILAGNGKSEWETRKQSQNINNWSINGFFFPFPLFLFSLSFF